MYEKKDVVLSHKRLSSCREMCNQADVVRILTGLWNLPLTRDLQIVDGSVAQNMCKQACAHIPTHAQMDAHVRTHTTHT